MGLFDRLRPAPTAAIDATLVVANAATLAQAGPFLDTLAQHGRVAVGVADGEPYTGAPPAIGARDLHDLRRLKPARVIVLGDVANGIALAQTCSAPCYWVNARDPRIATLKLVAVTVADARAHAALPTAQLTGDPLLNIPAPVAPPDIAFCERLTEVRERERWVGYFAATGAGEEDFAYLSFMQLSRKQMGLLALAPHDPTRYEPVYRDAIKYRLPTIRHLRLITSYIPHKTRVYYIEDAPALRAMYACADFVVVGGTLSAEARHAPDLFTPLTYGRPLIVGPRRDDYAVAAALGAGAVLGAENVDDIVRHALGLIGNADGGALTRAAATWLSSQRGAAARVMSILSA